MEEQKTTKKKNGVKSVIFFVIGALLIIGTLGNLKTIADWSTAELVGYNTWSIIAIVGGGYLVYLGIKK